MISILLHHKIFEWCINTFAEKIGSNFAKTEVIEVGSHFSRIRVDTYNQSGTMLPHEYRNCTITNSYHGKYFGKSVYLYNFVDDKGDIIMACSANDAQFLK